MKHGSSAVRPHSACDAEHMAVRGYRLVVEGELSDQLGSAFPGMTLTRREGQTLLVGPVRDQAELQGLMQRISSLGLTLLSASTIDDNESEGGRARRPT
jgi:hypothetical protein